MGVVYEVEDLKLGRLAALKFLPDQWFRADADLASRRKRSKDRTSDAKSPYVLVVS